MTPRHPGKGEAVLGLALRGDYVTDRVYLFAAYYEKTGHGPASHASLIALMGTMLRREST